MPLGSGALAGVAYQTDRKFLAAELGFSRISTNSMDAVSDRDFVVEFLTAASICMMHFSRMSEELILWSSGEFDFIRIGDDFTTGSSIMPQKRNPDFAESSCCSYFLDTHHTEHYRILITTSKQRCHHLNVF